MKPILLSLAFLPALALTTYAPPAWAEKDPIYTSWKNDIAVQGYDPVSFFVGKPVKGSKAFIFAYKGAQWRFSSQANMDLFMSNPKSFAPQYGGYCAWAVAHDKLAKGSAEHWTVTDGKLYLNYNERIKTLWEKDIPGFIRTGNQHWPQIISD